MSYIHITVTATTLENHFLRGESTVTFCIGSIDIYCEAPPNVCVIYTTAVTTVGHEGVLHFRGLR